MDDRISRRRIDESASLLQALKQMDVQHVKMLFVFDGDRFVSLLTIGDIQRAIIKHVPLNSFIASVIDTNKGYASLSDSEAEVRDKMLSMRAECMPVVDAEGNLVRAYFWNDFFEDTTSISNRAPIHLPVVIMAGGKGERLKPITNVIPKPLVPIGEKTILEEIMNQFEAIGCTKFYVSVNYKSDLLSYYLEQCEHHYNIEIFKESKPLGTIGSVSLLKGKITTPFFVSNCDIVIDQDMRDVYDYHLENKNDLTIVTAVKSISIPYGVVETGEDGLMIALREKPELTYMINTGVYILNPCCIADIPENEFFHVTQLMECVKKRGGRVGCFPVSEQSWKDMGEWGEYLRMINVR